MTTLLKTAPFVILMALSSPLGAQTAADGPSQDTPPVADTTTGEQPDALALSMGEDENAGPKLGDIYVEATFSDWELRCIKSEAEIDPCQIYQLLTDGKGNAVAEINFFPLIKEGGPAAGATVITPLETLLTQQLAVSVDGSRAKKYPFSWCSTVGCFSRLGFADSDVEAFRRGAKATLTIVPVAAPDQKVHLSVSLNGFTAAFEAAKARLVQ